MFIGTAVGLRDAEPLTASQEAAVSTVWSAVAMFAEMDTVTVYIVHVVGNRVVGHHEVDTHDDGEVRLFVTLWKSRLSAQFVASASM